ncbi:MAG TPA: hypothetical protein VNN15_04915 [Solirubrobacterales bacterium]|nr:hypothetical protein [Solirubrobacterales bacterium]
MSSNENPDADQHRQGEAWDSEADWARFRKRKAELDADFFASRARSRRLLARARAALERHSR